MLRRAAAALAMLVAPGASAPPPSSLRVYADAQQRVRLADRRRMNLYCTGRGSPVVVLEGGWTTETNYWFKVQPALSRGGRVCSYDRAGYGFSDPGPLPRTADAIERDLAAVIAAALISEPIILVAHSLGSYPARLHVDRHRTGVAALVLLDPPVEGVDAAYDRVKRGYTTAAFARAAGACSRAVIAGASLVPNADLCLGHPRPGLPDEVNAARARFQHTAAYQRTAQAEIEGMVGDSPARVARSRRSWGCLPMIVLTAEQGDDDPSLSPAQTRRIRAIRWRAQGRVAALSRCSAHRLLPRASHFIPIDAPQEAIRAVEQVRAMVRSRRRT